MPRNDYKLNKVPEGNISIANSLSSSWRKWFEDLYRMIGSENNYGITDWNPTITGLTGSATIENGRYFKFRKILYFNLLINNSGSTSSTLGNTYIEELPLSSVASGDCHLFNVSTRDIVGHGYIESGTTRIYLPTWLSISSDISLNGFVFVDG